jgi:hypothetical protein
VEDAPLGAFASLSAPATAVEEAVAGSSEALFVHAEAPAQISRNRQGNFVIDI